MTNNGKSPVASCIIESKAYGSLFFRLSHRVQGMKDINIKTDEKGRKMMVKRIKKEKRRKIIEKNGKGFIK